MSNKCKFKVGDIVISEVNGNYLLKGRKYIVTRVLNDNEICIDNKHTHYSGISTTNFSLYKKTEDGLIRCISCNNVIFNPDYGFSRCNNCLDYSK